MFFQRLGFSKPRKAYLGDFSECFRTLSFVPQGRIQRLVLVASREMAQDQRNLEAPGRKRDQFYLEPVIGFPIIGAEEKTLASMIFSIGIHG